MSAEPPSPADQRREELARERADALAHEEFCREIAKEAVAQIDQLSLIGYPALWPEQAAVAEVIIYDLLQQRLE